MKYLNLFVVFVLLLGLATPAFASELEVGVVIPNVVTLDREHVTLGVNTEVSTSANPGGESFASHVANSFVVRVPYSPIPEFCGFRYATIHVPVPAIGAEKDHVKAIFEVDQKCKPNWLISCSDSSIVVDTTLLAIGQKLDVSGAIDNNIGKTRLKVPWIGFSWAIGRNGERERFPLTLELIDMTPFLNEEAFSNETSARYEKDPSCATPLKSGNFYDNATRVGKEIAVKMAFEYLNREEGWKFTSPGIPSSQRIESAWRECNGLPLALDPPRPQQPAVSTTTTKVEETFGTSPIDFCLEVTCNGKPYSSSNVTIALKDSAKELPPAVLHSDGTIPVKGAMPGRYAYKVYWKGQPHSGWVPFTVRENGDVVPVLFAQ